MSGSALYYISVKYGPHLCWRDFRKPAIANLRFAPLRPHFSNAARPEKWMVRKSIISHSPLLYTMQAAERKPDRATIPVSQNVKKRVLSLKRGNQTYDDVLIRMLDTIAVGEKEREQGVVFLYEVPILDEIKKLKNPIPLKIVIDENNSLILVNNEYSILVVCSNLVEGLQEAALQFADDFMDYNDTSLPMTQDARELGEKLRGSVWL